MLSSIHAGRYTVFDDFEEGHVTILEAAVHFGVLSWSASRRFWMHEVTVPDCSGQLLPVWYGLDINSTASSVVRWMIL